MIGGQQDPGRACATTAESQADAQHRLAVFCGVVQQVAESRPPNERGPQTLFSSPHLHPDRECYKHGMYDTQCDSVEHKKGCEVRVWLTLSRTCEDRQSASHVDPWDRDGSCTPASLLGRQRGSPCRTHITQQLLQALTAAQLLTLDDELECEHSHAHQRRPPIQLQPHQWGRGSMGRRALFRTGSGSSWLLVKDSGAQLPTALPHRLPRGVLLRGGEETSLQAEAKRCSATTRVVGPPP